MQVKKNIYYLWLIVFVFAGCDSFKNENAGATIIKGRIEIPAADKIYFYTYADTVDLYLDNKTSTDSATIDQKGNYFLSPHFKNAYPFDLKCGNNFLATNLFLTPGDKIKINFHGKDSKPDIFPSGGVEKFNNFLIKFSDVFYKDPETKQDYYITSNFMDIHQFTKYNNDRKQKQLDLFNNSFEKNLLKKEFKDYALNTINYGIAVDRLMYLWKKRMKGEPVTIDSSYLDFEIPAFVENKNALNCPAYTRFLYLYIKDIYERLVETGDLPEDKSEKLIPQLEKYKIAKKLLNRPFSDVVICNIIIGDMNDINQKNAVNYFSKISVDSLMILFQNKYSLK